jgi:hypothetical protein
MTLAALMRGSCDKEEAILMDELPANALGFVEAHYDGKKILHVIKELDNLKTYYHVYLDNGTKLDFNRQGTIKKIEGVEKIPDTVIPQLILDYVQTNYSGEFIHGWEVSDATQDVKLSNEIDLEFDRNGNFLRING